ncbi:MAG: hypothetical protein FJY85_00495 [Deltaproteobacteria bacterium]|nr:hypothetical protein [Deltaproteobacteria bacterium]
MTDRPEQRTFFGVTVDARIPFTFVLVHGINSTVRSSEHKSTTRSVNLTGLTFETESIHYDGLHLSFTESAYGRNSLEIKLDLGKKIGEISVIGQVSWYERRATATRHTFIVGVSFIDVQADEMVALREFLQQAQSQGR